MTDDFGKSESDANLIIDGIKTKAIIEEVRSKGGSPLDVASAVLKGVDMKLLGKQIKVFSFMSAVYSVIPGKEEMQDWWVLGDYRYVAQGYVTHPRALAWNTFFNKVNTIKDVFQYVLDKEHLSLDEYLEFLPGVDRQWFEQFLTDTPIMHFLVFAKTKQEYLEKYEKAMAEHSVDMKRVQEQHDLHKTLMKD